MNSCARNSLTASLLSAVVLLGFEAAGRPEDAPVPLATFPSQALEFSAWMRAQGWQSKRDEPRGCEVGGGILHLLSGGNSVLIGTERGFPRDVRRTPILRLRLKVGSVPRGTDLTRKSGDDAALRVYIVFDKGGGLFTPPNTIAYTWTEKEDAGTMIQSEHFSNLLYISLGKGATPADEWVVVERDLAADHRRAFPADAQLPRLKALMVKCDSNNTQTSAESWLSAVSVQGE